MTLGQTLGELTVCSHSKQSQTPHSTCKRKCCSKEGKQQSEMEVATPPKLL